MTGLRSYGDPCGIARALDVIGERWSLLIVRELLFGPKRFSDLRASLGASPNVLSQRLGELEASGVVQKRRSGGVLYDLSDWGRELHPILLQLGRWGAQSSHKPAGLITVDALMAALEATFRAGVPKASGVIELRLGDERFSVHITGDACEIRRGLSRKPDAVIETDPTTLRAVVFGDGRLASAAVETKGNLALAKSFFLLFAR